jgi:hypothetical protein
VGFLRGNAGHGLRGAQSFLAAGSRGQRRIELIQDFTMPTASTTLRISPDNRFVFAAGTYKPRVRCYEFSELSMKFERSLDAEGAAWPPSPFHERKCALRPLLCSRDL